MKYFKFVLIYFFIVLMLLLLLYSSKDKPDGFMISDEKVLVITNIERYRGGYKKVFGATIINPDFYKITFENNGHLLLSNSFNVLETDINKFNIGDSISLRIISKYRYYPN